jgi:hypothetical protein
LLLASLLSGGSAIAELRVPAFTAYLDPDAEGASVKAQSGISNWIGPTLRVLWFGQLTTNGVLDCSLVLRLPTNATSSLRLTVAGQSREITAKGGGTEPITVRFGSFDIPSPGYQRFTLTSLNGAGQSNGDLEALILDGRAAENAHFNLKPRRNAASVHLFYPVPKDTQVEHPPPYAGARTSAPWPSWPDRAGDRDNQWAQAGKENPRRDRPIPPAVWRDFLPPTHGSQDDGDSRLAGFYLLCKRRVCFFEVKRPGQQPDPAQTKVLAALAEAGAFVRVVYSLQEAIDAYREACSQQ